jgi:DNA polymerase III delta prime subunit
MESLWVNKYRPKELSHIIGHKIQTNKFKDWLINIKNKPKNNAIIISGNHGIGKTLTIQLILEEAGYLVRIINPNEIKDFRNLDDFDEYYNQNNSILSKLNFYKDKNNKIALIFDETENISLTSEKKYIMDIFKENNKTNSFPLIFVSNNQHSKLLNDLKKNCDEIRFFSPSTFEIKNLIRTICKNENFYIKDDDELYDKIINFSQFDIKRLINILQELSFHYKKIEKIETLEFFFEKSRQKNIDIGLYEATEKLLNNYNDYETVIKLYESEKVLLPLMIHEHYLKKILTKSNQSWDKVIYSLVKTSDSISRGDNIETSIYTDQNWYLQNIHGFYTCLNTSFWINKVNSNYNLTVDKMKFSSDLNKTSLKNINRKNINNLIKIISNKSIDEIIYINQLANHLFKEGKEGVLINILQNYKKDISVKEIELCLKIDKTQDFLSLSSKEKKALSKKYNISLANK